MCTPCNVMAAILSGSASSNSAGFVLTSSNAAVTWPTPPVDAFLFRFKAKASNASAIQWTTAFGDTTSAYTYTFSNDRVVTGYTSNSVPYTIATTTTALGLSSNSHDIALKCSADEAQPDMCKYALFVDGVQAGPTNSVPSMSFSNGGGFTISTRYAPSNSLSLGAVDYNPIMTVAQPLHADTVYARTYLNLPDFRSNLSSGWAVGSNSTATACNVYSTGTINCYWDAAGCNGTFVELRSNGSLVCGGGPYNYNKLTMGVHQYSPLSIIQSRMNEGNNNPSYFGVSPSNWFALALNPEGGFVGVNTSNPHCSLDVNGTIQGLTILQAGQPVATASNLASVTSNLNVLANATLYGLTHLTWSNIMDAPPIYTTSNSSNSTTGINWGNTIIQGVVGGAAGLATQYALQAGGQKLFDMAGNMASDLTSQVISVAGEEIDARLFGGPSSSLLNSAIDNEISGRFSTGYFNSAKWGLTSVAIDGSNHTVFCGLTASNVGVTHSSNAITGCNVPLSLRTITGCNAPVTVVTCDGSNFSASNVVVGNTLITPGTLYSTGTINCFYAPAGCNGTFVELRSNGSLVCGGGPYNYNKLIVGVDQYSPLSFIQARMNESNVTPSYFGTSTSNWFALALNPEGGYVGVNTSNPHCALDVYGTIQGLTLLQAGQPVALSNSLNNYQLVTAATSFSNWVSPLATAAATVNNSGWRLGSNQVWCTCNVGINTTNPAYNLDVYGDIRAQNNLRTSNLVCTNISTSNVGTDFLHVAVDGYVGGSLQATYGVSTTTVTACNGTFSNQLSTGYLNVASNAYVLGSVQANYAVSTPTISAYNGAFSNQVNTGYLNVASNAYVLGSVQANYAVSTTTITACNAILSNVTSPSFTFVGAGSNAFTHTNLAFGEFTPGFATVNGNSLYVNVFAKYQRVGGIVTVMGAVMLDVQAAYVAPTSFNIYNLPYSVRTVPYFNPEGIASGTAMFSATAGYYNGTVVPIDANNIQIYLNVGFGVQWVKVYYTFTYQSA